MAKAGASIDAPSSQALGTERIGQDIEAGETTIRMTARDGWTSPHGSIHGGFVAAMMDEAIGTPVFVISGGKSAPLMLDLNVTYLAPVYPGPVIGKGRVIKMGKKVAFLEASLEDETGKELARGTSKAMLVKITNNGKI